MRADEGDIVASRRTNAAIHERRIIILVPTFDL